MTVKNQAIKIKSSNELPLVILVRKSADTYVEILHKVRSGVNVNVTGYRISGIREIRSGDLLILISGEKRAADLVKQEVENFMGANSNVTKLNRIGLIELSDLDALTTKKEVVLVIERETGNLSDMSVLNIRRTFVDGQAALVLLAQNNTNRLVSTGRVRVGIVYSHIRVREEKIRCYRCLAFGHVGRFGQEQLL